MDSSKHLDGPISPGCAPVSSEPSSMLERMVDALGGWSAVVADPVRLPSFAPPASPPELVRGVVLAERYELLGPLANASDDTFRAVDRTTRQDVLLRVLRDLPVDSTLTERFQLAVSVSHPNVCRVHDLVPTAAGPVVIMSGLAGETLATRLEGLRPRGGPSVEAFRRIASDVFAGLAAIHARDAVHGALDPRSILVTDRKAVLLDFAFAAGSPHLQQLPPALRSSRVSADLKAAGRICWSMFRQDEPLPEEDPRGLPLRAQSVSELPRRLASDELRQIFASLSGDPEIQPRARNARFVQPAGRTPSFVRQEHRLSPGPPPGTTREAFVPGRQSLFVTFSATAPDSVGDLIPLERPELTIGRGTRADIQLGERTVSSVHARLTWERGHWTVNDLGSLNGTFTDDDYARQEHAVLRHGGEIQLAEARVMLVSFGRDSPDHARALAHCARRDALTGLLDPVALRAALEEEARFAAWAELPMQVVRYRVVRGGPPTERLAILEQLAVRRVARRAAELTDNMLLSLTPVVAGRPRDVDHAGSEPRGTFLLAMVGPTEAQAQNVVDLVVSESRAHLPSGFTLEARLQRGGGG